MGKGNYLPVAAGAEHKRSAPSHALLLREVGEHAAEVQAHLLSATAMALNTTLNIEMHYRG